MNYATGNPVNQHNVIMQYQEQLLSAQIEPLHILVFKSSWHSNGEHVLAQLQDIAPTGIREAFPGVLFH